MTLNKTILTGALILGATIGLTTATMAQPYDAGRYHAGPGYYRGFNYGYGPSRNDTERGGPGPRVGAGSGLGIGAER